MLRFLGENYEIRFEYANFQKLEIRFERPYLKVLSAKHVPVAQVRKEILKFYEKAARRFLPKRVESLAKMTGLIPAKVILRRQKTVWGSCSPSGNIQLNWKLVSAPINVIDYVIIHELAHLKHPNHSKYFWAEVEKHCPDYRQQRLWLKRHYFSFDYLNETSELHSSKLPSDLR